MYGKPLKSGAYEVAQEQKQVLTQAGPSVVELRLWRSCSTPTPWETAAFLSCTRDLTILSCKHARRRRP